MEVPLRGRTVTARSRRDYAFSVGGGLAPEASESLATGGVWEQKDPAPVDQVTGEIAFAQLADGTVSGSDPAAMKSWLVGERQGELRAYQYLLSVYRAQGESGLKSAIESSTMSDTVAERGLKLALRLVERKDGLSAVVARVEAGASTRLPN